MTLPSKRWLLAALVAIVAVAGYYGWQKFGVRNLPDGIASGNGRIEAQVAPRMSRVAVFILLIAGHVLGLSLAARAEEADVTALRRTIGQKIVVGFFGQKNTAPDFRRVLGNLEQGIVGGVLFLGRNISNRTDLETMIREIKNCDCSARPLIAIDEEGGAIERLGESQGFSHTASAAETARDSEEKARAGYRRLASKLSELGFNMNLAPVVDLNINSTNPIIGRLGRSFSNSPQTVSRYASIFIEEHHKLGIATVLKHFPGHGSSANDSHDSIADVETSWSSVELVPYEDLIGLGMADCVMAGHLSNVSRWGGVATQDGSRAIEHMLRGDLNFEGVVMSDDLSMKAVRSPAQPFSEVIKSSVRTGVDIVIVSRLNDDDETSDTGDYANSAILNGILTGKEIDRAAIDRSVERIEFLKKEIADKFASRARYKANRN